MNEETMYIRGIIHMLANRIERLEEKIDALEEEKRVASKKEFDDFKKYFKKELNKLDKFI